MPINKGEIKNILVLRNDRFGEFLLNIPALRAIKETFPDAHIILTVNPRVRGLAQNLPYIDEIIEWAPEAKHSLSEKLRLINLLKKKHIDTAVMLNPSKEFNIFSYLSGIPVRVGYARKWGFLLTHKMEDKKYLAKMHEVEYNLELVNLIGARAKDKTLSLPVDDTASGGLCKKFGISGSEKLVAVHPWTSDPVKQWPFRNFTELVKRLAGETNIKVLVIGGKEEESQSRKLFGNPKQDNIIDLTGQTTLEQLAAVLKRCSLLISGDSGPVHLACCVGTPVIAIFRSDIPAKSAVRWGPWGKGHIVIQKNNLSDISVEEVLDAAKKIPHY